MAAAGKHISEAHHVIMRKHHVGGFVVSDECKAKSCFRFVGAVSSAVRRLQERPNYTVRSAAYE